MSKVTRRFVGLSPHVWSTVQTRPHLTGRLREIPPWPEMGGQHPDMVCWPLGHILVPLNDPEVNLAFSAFTASETASLSSI